ncbi:hypothetical protein, partial [Dickeya oryzae]
FLSPSPQNHASRCVYAGVMLRAGEPMNDDGEHIVMSQRASVLLFIHLVYSQDKFIFMKIITKEIIKQ